MKCVERQIFQFSIKAITNFISEDLFTSLNFVFKTKKSSFESDKV